MTCRKTLKEAALEIDSSLGYFRTYSRAYHSDFGSIGRGSPDINDFVPWSRHFFLDLGDKTEIFSTTISFLHENFLTGPAMMFLQLDSAAYTAELHVDDHAVI